MLSVCLIFLYVLLMAYVTGFAVLKAVRHFCTKDKAKDEPEAFWCKIRTDGYIMAGLILLTVYAQFFSLFYKVGLAANLLLVIVCIAIVFIYKKELMEEALKVCGRMNGYKAAGCIFLFLAFAYGTSRGIIHYDTGLYHAQSIRWIEEYGIVKGLGNLHCRLAYNSSAFSLSALFSFSFLGGQSYHCLAGLFALILAKVCGGIVRAWKRKKLLLSDFARIMGIYYLLIIFDEMVSPASDYFMVLTVFYIVIRYLDLLENGEKSYIPYGLLSLICVYTMSLKLSAALILLLVIKPAAILIKERNIRGIFSFTGIGVIIMLPFLIRNVIISGWLVYPFTFIDLFPAGWKIPKQIADYDAREIQVWGRGIYDVARFEEPVSAWFLPWFASQGNVDRFFILAGLSGVALLGIAAVIILIKRKKRMADWLLVAAVIDFSFLFWLFSAPLIRYGCVYVWLAPVITFGGLALELVKNKRIWQMLYLAVGLAGCYKAFAFGKEVIAACDGQYFIRQKDYENFQTEAYEIEGVTFYYPTEGDRTGYEAFPASPSRADILLFSGDIKDGFKYNKTE